MRHHDTKEGQLKEICDKLRRNVAHAKAVGNTRRSQSLEALVSARESDIRKLNGNVELRLKQLAEQRKFVPEWSEVSCLLIEVTP